MTRKAWEDAGFRANSRRLPAYLSKTFFSKFPKTSKARYPHQIEGFKVLESFKSKPILLKLFFPVRELRLGHEAGKIIRRTLHDNLMGRVNRRHTKHEPVPRDLSWDASRLCHKTFLGKPQVYSWDAPLVCRLHFPGFCSRWMDDAWLRLRTTSVSACGNRISHIGLSSSIYPAYVVVRRSEGSKKRRPTSKRSRSMWKRRRRWVGEMDG